MTFGRPPGIPNDYIQMALPQELDLDAFDVQSVGVMHCQGPSTATVYVQSM